MIEAFWGVAAMLGLSFLRLPIAFSLALVGFFGFAHLTSTSAALSMIASVTHESGMSYTLSVIPLFVLMGSFVTRAGLSRELYAASHAFLGHRRGGLAMATIVACGGFSAICGSSLATAATMSKVAIPSMREYGYADTLAAGSVAAGGTLGILLPPSVILIIYGFLTETSIGALFAAGVIPGLLAVMLYIAAIAVMIRIDPTLGPQSEASDARARLRALLRVWQVLVLFVLVMGGIYGGVFTPTEAAGVGAFGAFIFVILRAKPDMALLRAVLRDAAETTAMLFSVVIGAMIFSNFISISGVTGALSDTVQALQWSPAMVLAVIIAFYIVLGAVLETMSMVLLTVPVIYPIVAGLGYDLVWFGIIVVVVTEVSLITPPIGMNVFVLRSILPDIRMATIFRGVFPFVLADIVRLALLTLFPTLSLFLPHLFAL
ncbi:TRAP transporter large permease [Pikeienuella piscinae]|uniref:TRAP transporter large permease protein n=1 Tax=Pikeienuella piscinae TaxID=2748098 RepID=A0A7L5BYD6_9RHOB|nr:TRAP transporter large permease [Pikeienuella piscinae]QIE54904.1 TRAP transporter large permease [Pikeienuella piscinae]